MCLKTEEFLRRFLLHVLPSGFVRIRHYGLMAGANVASKLPLCRALLSVTKPTVSEPRKTWVDRVLEWTGNDPTRCPHCNGPLIRRALARPMLSTVQSSSTQEKRLPVDSP